MAKRIGVLAADQAATDSPTFFEKKSVVRRWIRHAEAVWIVYGHLAQKLEASVRTAGTILVRAASSYIDGPLGRGNVLPFARPHNYGEKLHYEVPMAGDRSCLARHRPRKFRVSSRNLFARQPIPAVPLTV